MADVDVSGLRAQARHFARAQAEIYGLSAAIVASGAADVVRIARQNLADNRITGATSASVGYDLTDGGLTATIGPTSDPAALALEYGTSRQAPQPFLRPAYDEVRTRVAVQLAVVAARAMR